MLDRQKLTDLERAVWAAQYVRALEDRHTEEAAARDSDEVVVRLRRYVLAPSEWGGA